MLVKIILNYILGYLNITVEGFFIERFINICSSKKIFLWNLKKKNPSILSANISIKDFKKIKEICKKTKCKVSIKNKKGIPFLFDKYKKRKMFIILLIPVAIVTIVSSMYVWNIEIDGTQNIDKKELLEELKNKGLDVGKLKTKIDTKNIINNIRLEREDISSLSNLILLIIFLVSIFLLFLPISNPCSLSSKSNSFLSMLFVPTTSIFHIYIDEIIVTAITLSNKIKNIFLFLYL